MDSPQQNNDIDRRPRILLVDDVPANLALAKALLNSLGVQTQLAENGPTALRLAAQDPQPDLILLDIMMPGMDGHQVLEHLRENPRTRSIPVIFVTALDSPNDEQSGLLEGAVDYISKPLQAAIFRARVKNQLELKGARDQLARQNLDLEAEVERRLNENQTLNTRLQLALSASGMGIWEYHPVEATMHWNDDLCQILGIAEPPADLEACFRYIHPQDQARIQQALFDPPNPGMEIRVEEFRLQHHEGHWIWVEGRGKTVRTDTQGQPILVAGTITDITQRKLAEIEQQLTAIVFAGVNNGICITDASRRILMVNEAFVSLTGFSKDELLGQTPDLIRSGQHSPAFFQSIYENLHTHGHWQGEIINRRKNGQVSSDWVSISTVKDPDGQITHYVAVYYDLSESRQAAERIEYLSNFDLLTDLPNRTLFSDRLAQALLTAQRYERQTAVLLLDLERFHAINESFGPSVGDFLLRQVADRLKLQVRDGDTVGRRSGSEFGFIMANLGDEQDVIALAQRMLDAITGPFQIEGQSILLAARIGISVAPRDGSHADELEKAASLALSRAKEGGEGRYHFYSPEMDARASRRRSLENALRCAIDNNELTVFYQPQVSLETGRIIGMEALLRWQSQSLGPVSPAEFIPLAEETGLILPIGEWVLKTACEQASRWQSLVQGSMLRLAVNLSAKQFHQHNLLQMVSETLQTSGFAAANLELEVTESAFIDNVEQAVMLCRQLKKLGLKLSLDDFGTGYSSLSSISRFPFDKIKIDQSFVRDIIANPVNAAIANSAIAMAHSMNLATVAEGVETEAQAGYLRGLQCDAIQGYLFSRPVPAADFEQLLRTHKTLVMDELVGNDQKTRLIVDDEPHVLSALTRLLRRESFTTLTAKSPAEAFELLARHPVQVILSDQRMPEMSGTEFLSRARQMYPKTIRMVLTGYTDLDSIASAVNRGAIAKFLTKPWDDDQLREEIRQAFRTAAANDQEHP